MEKSKKIIYENSSTIQTVVNTISTLLSELVALNEKNVATLKEEELEVSEKVLQHTRVSRSQCTMLCTLNKMVIDVEALLMTRCECDSCDHARDCDRSANSLRTPINCDVREFPQELETIPQKTEADSKNTQTIQHEIETVLQEIESTEVGLVQSEANVENLSSPNRKCADETVEGSSRDIVETVKRYEQIYQDHEMRHAHFKPSGRKTVSKNNNSKEHSAGCYEIREKATPLINNFCVVSHMESPSEFYIQIIDDDVVHINEITNMLRAAYSNTKCRYKSKAAICDELGMYCVVYVSKFDQWYRAKVLDWLSDSSRTEYVYVQLIDYGHCYYVPYYELRPMLYEVSHFPKMAQQCHLHCICPLNQEEKKREQYKWSTDAIETYLDILKPSLDTQFQIVFVKKCGESIGIDLLKMDEESSVSEQLLKLELVAVTFVDENEKLRSKLMVQQVLGAQGVSALPTMSETEKLTRFFDTVLPVEKTEDINEAIGNYNPTDEKRICKFQTKCRKKNCKFEHVPLTKGFTTDRLPVFSIAVNESGLPKGGDEITLRITCVKTVCNFYIHLNPFLHDTVYSQFLQMDEIMNHPNTIKTYKVMKLFPAAGEIVIVKNWDGRWCRAQVYKAEDNAENADLQVFIVDFGDVVDVKLSDVRQIEEEFLQVPFQAVECRLFNVTINEDSSATEAKEYLEFYHMCSNYKAQVISANVGYLELLISLENGDDLGESLIRKGFATARPKEFVPMESEYFLVD